MKRFLLAASSALALAAAQPAQAQLTVIDPAHITQTIAESAKQIVEAQRQYQQLVMTYEAIAHQTDLSSVAALLGGMSRTFMPGAGEVPGLLGGQAGTWGQAQAMLERNRYFDVGQEDPWGREMQRRERATANAQALAAAGLEDAQQRVEALEGLRARLEAAENGTELAAVQGAIAVEQQNLAAHRAQIEQTRLLLAAEDRVERQRAEQQRKESAQMLLESTAPLSGGLR